MLGRLTCGTPADFDLEIGTNCSAMAADARFDLLRICCKTVLPAVFPRAPAPDSCRVRRSNLAKGRWITVRSSRAVPVPIAIPPMASLRTALGLRTAPMSNAPSARVTRTRPMSSVEISGLTDVTAAQHNALRCPLTPVIDASHFAQALQRLRARGWAAILWSCRDT